MHEILFRGKRTDDGKWVYGDLTHSVYKIGDTCVGKYGCEIGMHQVDPSTVWQYTGLTDKNGKRIFEGDVVDAVRSGDETWRCVVSDIRKIPAEMCGSNVKSMDIVGNIHDNPELLGAHDGGPED